MGKKVLLKFSVIIVVILSIITVSMISLFAGNTNPYVVYFGAEKFNIDQGQSTTLHWKLKNVNTVEIEGMTKAFSPMDQLTVTPSKNTTYVLKAKNSSGQSVKAQVTIYINNTSINNGSFIENFITNYYFVSKGYPVKLSWKTDSGYTKVQISGFPDGNSKDVATEASMTVTPNETTKYTLKSNDLFGRTEIAEITVYVDNEVVETKGKINSFTASPSVIYADQSTLLKWSTENCWVIQIFDQKQAIAQGLPEGGEITVSPTETTKYRIVAKDYDNTEHSREVVVTVKKNPKIHYFNANKNNIKPGEDVLLSWKAEDSNKIEIAGDQGVIAQNLPAEGNYRVNPKVNSKYILRVYADNGTVKTADVSIIVIEPKTTIHHFNANKTHIKHGEDVLVSWRTENASRIEIEGLDPKPSGILPLDGQQTVYPKVTTRYILRAYAPNGAVQSAEFTVYVNNTANIHYFNATPTVVNNNEPVLLQWKVDNASQVRLIGGNDYNNYVVLEGTQYVYPKATTTYTLQAWGYDNQLIAQQITVQVNKPNDDTPNDDPRILSFAASNYTVQKNQQVTLYWNTANASKIRILDDNNARVYEGPAIGQCIVTLYNPTTYKLVAFNNKNERVTSHLTINVVN